MFDALQDRRYSDHVIRFLPRTFAVCAAALFIVFALAAPASGQVLLSGTAGTPETDISPEQEQHLLNEYWTLARKYKVDPLKTVSDFSLWTKDRIGKVQSIQFQPEKPGRPEYLEGKAEWKPEVLRMAAILHTDLALAAFQKREIMEFEFHIGIADGWMILADNKLSKPGELRSRWTVTIARHLLASGEVGIAERILNRAVERIAGDPAILLAQATVKETQASRFVANVAGGRLEEPASASKVRDAALTAAQNALEKALKIQPTLTEAKVRLAHVLSMKHDDSRAYSLASEVIAGNASPTLKYIASLVGGAILERDKQMDAAAKLYVQAILAMPDGQSGYIALANILHLSGQRTEAGAVLDRLFARPVPTATSDPWWTYPLGLDLAMDAQFEEYRKLVRK